MIMLIREWVHGRNIISNSLNNYYPISKLNDVYIFPSKLDQKLVESNSNYPVVLYDENKLIKDYYTELQPHILDDLNQILLLKHNSIIPLKRDYPIQIYLERNEKENSYSFLKIGAFVWGIVTSMYTIIRLTNFLTGRMGIIRRNIAHAGVQVRRANLGIQDMPIFQIPGFELFNRDAGVMVDRPNFDIQDQDIIQQERREVQQPIRRLEDIGGIRQDIEGRENAMINMQRDMLRDIINIHMDRLVNGNMGDMRINELEERLNVLVEELQQLRWVNNMQADVIHNQENILEQRNEAQHAARNLELQLQNEQNLRQLELAGQEREFNQQLDFHRNEIDNINEARNQIQNDFQALQEQLNNIAIEHGNVVNEVHNEIDIEPLGDEGGLNEALMLFIERNGNMNYLYKILKDIALKITSLASIGVALKNIIEKDEKEEELHKTQQYINSLEKRNAILNAKNIQLESELRMKNEALASRSFDMRVVSIRHLINKYYYYLRLIFPNVKTNEILHLDQEGDKLIDYMANTELSINDRANIKLEYYKLTTAIDELNKEGFDVLDAFNSKDKEDFFEWLHMIEERRFFLEMPSRTPEIAAWYESNLRAWFYTEVNKKAIRLAILGALMSVSKTQNTGIFNILAQFLSYRIDRTISDISSQILEILKGYFDVSKLEDLTLPKNMKRIREIFNFTDMTEGYIVIRGIANKLIKKI